MLRAVAIVATCLLIASVGIAYVAYWFTPAQATGYESSFLVANTSEIVDAAGFRVHFLDQGAGLPIVLIHGGGTWLYSFRHNLEPLAGFARVLALDMPGHGYTERTHSDALYDFETTDQVLLEFLDAKGIGQAALVGHSWGGTWALHFAQRYPERVNKLILIASTGMHGGDERLEWELLKVPVVAEIMAKLFRSGAVERGLRAAFADPRIVTPEMVQELYLPVSSPENRMAQVSYSRRLDLDEVRSRVGETQTPTLIIWGSRDQYGGFEDGRALAEAMPRARFELIDDAGHNVHEEKPTEVNALIEDFIGSADYPVRQSGAHSSPRP